MSASVWGGRRGWELNKKRRDSHTFTDLFEFLVLIHGYSPPQRYVSKIDRLAGRLDHTLTRSGRGVREKSRGRSGPVVG